ncbi:MAG: DNA translocase FtsK 4TM domain-containing protein [Pseudomonadota bacterium]
MAYQSHGRNPGREPLLDQNMQAALERRGRELIGLILVGLGLLAAMAIGSYSPDDPNWMVATDAPVQNWLGRAGATIAAPLFMIVGWGAFGIGILLMAWGVRFGLNLGRDRAFSRLIFAPIAIALASVYAATLAPPTGWSHSFGLGGLFGDTVLLMILQIIPGTAALGAKLISLIAGLMILTFGAFVLGFTWAEIYRLTRWMVLGLVLIYAFLMKAVGRSASLGAAASRKAADVSRKAADAYAAKKAAQREEEAANEELWAQQMHNVGRDDAEERQRVAQVIRANLAAEQGLEPAAAAPIPYVPLEEEPKAGLRALMPSFTKKEAPREMPEPELVAPAPLSGDLPETSEDRLRSKIAKAIRTRGKTEPIGPAPIGPVVGAAGVAAAAPMVASAAPFMRPEPQLTRDLAAAAPVAEPVSAPETPALDAAMPPMDAPDAADTAALSFAEDETLEPAPPVLAPEPPKSIVQHTPKKPVRPSTRAMEEAQPKLSFVEERPEYEHPPLSLLMNPDQVERHHLSDEALEENARMLESVLDDYGVKGEIVSVRPGPVVTMYELEPAPGLKASRVIGLADDIARSMSALSARVSTVPGRSVIGIELPNEKREMVALREILAGRDFGDTNMRLPLALGKDIGGDPIVANLAKMPHLLIAGTTGSGKSVAINTMILSLLYRLSPEECRLIMIDPKMLELSVYDGIPHLLSPVVTDPKKAVVALKWVVGEMEERYRKMSKMGVRNIEGHNSRVADALSKDEMFTRTVQTGFDEDTGEPVFETEEIQPEKLPYIVVIVDEMADLMMVAGKEIEACIQRLAQMARASGIHLIMATQRPSVDVITGTIKANFPTRISFQVTSKVDSRTILGEMGAEQLLGMGDMLYMAGGAKITRVHGPFCSDEEVEEIVTYLKAYGPPEYVGGVIDGPAEDKESDIDLVLGLAGGGAIGGNTDGEDALYDQAVGIVIKDRKCSTSYIQRKLAIGYNKAARLVEQMEDEGVVSAANHVGKREILVPEQH